MENGGATNPAFVLPPTAILPPAAGLGLMPALPLFPPSALLTRVLTASSRRRPRNDKKSTPQEAQDERYFERRRKNNISAKRSRDSRKIREDQGEGRLKRESHDVAHNWVALSPCSPGYPLDGRDGDPLLLWLGAGNKMYLLVLLMLVSSCWSLQWMNVPNSNVSFSLSFADASYAQAEIMCEKAGAELAYIESKKESEFVTDMLKRWQLGRVWIAGFDGHRVSFTSDAQSRRRRPLLEGVQRKCGIIQNTFAWYPSNCKEEKPFVCQRQVWGKNAKSGIEYQIQNDTPSGFREAEAACREKNGSLVQVDNSNDEKFISSMEGYDPYKFYWIGLIHTAEGEYVWTDTLKTSKEIETRMSGGSECVMVQPKLEWGFTSCDNKRLSLCETKDQRHVFTNTPFLYDNSTRSYLFTTQEPQPFDAAEKKCRERGGNLVTIKGAERDGLLTATRDLPRNLWEIGSWIGLLDLDGEGANLSWVDKTPVKYRNLIDDTCLQLRSFSRWRKDSCEVPSKFICKRQQVVPLCPPGSCGYQLGENHWPWMVAIVDEDDDEVLCAGVIVSTRHILTVGNCVERYKRTPSFLKVQTKDQETESKFHYVEEVFIHPGYDSGTVSRNIAVILLSGGLRLSCDVALICLNVHAANPDHTSSASTTASDTDDDVETLVTYNYVARSFVRVQQTIKGLRSVIDGSPFLRKATNGNWYTIALQVSFLERQNAFLRAHVAYHRDEMAALTKLAYTETLAQKESNEEAVPTGNRDSPREQKDEETVDKE
ncbi:unnamed protein product [Cyprideis torosa]|uniref:Uncharacterized protein n=1 Tax=Cyprideis torosa TaxID=163714 RepID=A0A7R8W7W8_9CRUS|nr:unnamed protein product [Cyprideis torosa]CAG0887995.1 unnamed protein product [Cyprideis torosa]